MEKVINTPFARETRLFFNRNTGKVGNTLKEVYNGEPISQNALKWFFTIGYIPGELTMFEDNICLPGGAELVIKNNDYKIKSIWTYDNLNIPKIESYKKDDSNSIVSSAVEIFNKIIVEILQKKNCSTMYLTGGVDSRAILFSLLKHYSGKEINTFTFGYKGSYDIEISRKLAKKYGLNHQEVVLDNFDFTLEHLLEFIDLSDGLVNAFQQPPHRECLDFCNRHGGTVWTGVGGGASMGANLPKKDNQEHPVLNLIKQDSGRVGNLFMGAGSVIGDYPNINDINCLVAHNYTYDGIDFENHHEKLVAPTILFREHKNINPFLVPIWLGFWFSLKRDSRIDRRLSIQFLNDLDKNALKIKTTLHHKKKKSIIRKVSQKVLFGNRSRTKLLDSSFFKGNINKSGEFLDFFNNISIYKLRENPKIEEIAITIFQAYKYFNEKKSS